MPALRHRLLEAEPGEVLATAAGIEPGDLDGWFRAWTDLGSRGDAIAGRAAQLGRDERASDGVLAPRLRNRRVFDRLEEVLVG